MQKPSKVNSLPHKPGVYIFRDSEGEIIYIGKAKNLKNRVSSYFTGSDKSVKTKTLVKHINDLDYYILDSEVEALLLENRLIKKHTPKYNINLKDAKTYAYIKITKEKFPKIATARKLDGSSTFYGPFTDGTHRREILNLTLKLFKLRVCRKMPKKACLNYHINLCTAPCINAVSEEEYNKQVENAKSFLNGNTQETLNRLYNEMHEASNELKFEIALEKRKQIEAIEKANERQKVDLVKDYDQDVIAIMTDNEEKNALIQVFNISKGTISGKKEYRFPFEDEEMLESFIKTYYSNSPPKEIIVNKKFYENEEEKNVLEEFLSKIRGSKVQITLPKRGEKLSLVKLAEKNAKENLEGGGVLEQIKEAFTLSTVPEIIECFDMSNLGKEHLVGAMTRWVDGQPDKEGYRRFKIKSFQGKNDDYAAMKEVIERRYSSLKEKGGKYPELIIIDGGKGQLNAGEEALKSLGLQIPIISLAKKEEEIFVPGEENPRKYNKNSQMMLFIRKVRDYTHNYVVGYNRKRRSMQLRDEVEK